MNRRRFLGLLGKTTAATAIAYSFPSIIVPKNVETINHHTINDSINQASSYLSELNKITFREIYPKIIDDYFFCGYSILKISQRSR